MDKCSGLSKEVIDDVVAFYVAEYVVVSDEHLLGTMGEYGRLLLGVFHGYAEDKYPHLNTCESCYEKLANIVKDTNINTWLKDHPQ